MPQLLAFTLSKAKQSKKCIAIYSLTNNYGFSISYEAPLSDDLLSGIV